MNACVCVFRATDQQCISVCIDRSVYIYIYICIYVSSYPDNPDIYIHSYDSPDNPDNPPHDISTRSYDNDNPAHVI